MKNSPVLAILKKAAKGLLFPSESDAPLEPFQWGHEEPPTPEALAADAGLEEGAPTETMTLPAFFRAIPKEDKPKFDALAKSLKDNLANVKVYKVGEVNVKVYILGKTTDGAWAGLTTELVET